MGTVASLDIRGGATDGLDAAIRSLHDADARFSTYRADSEIRRIDGGALRLADASADVRAVLARCERLREETGGYLRRARRRPARSLRAGQGLGGPARGRPAHGRWADGLLPQRRRRRDHARGRAVRDRAGRSGFSTRTTAARSRRGSRQATCRSRPPAPTSAARTSSTRTPASAPSDVLSVTVTGPDLGTADAYSTAAFAMGARGPAWTLGLRRLRGADDPRRRHRAEHARLPRGGRMSGGSLWAGRRPGEPESGELAVAPAAPAAPRSARLARGRRARPRPRTAAAAPPAVAARAPPRARAAAAGGRRRPRGSRRARAGRHARARGRGREPRLAAGAGRGRDRRRTLERARGGVRDGRSSSRWWPAADRWSAPSARTGSCAGTAGSGRGRCTC